MIIAKFLKWIKGLKKKKEPTIIHRTFWLIRLSGNKRKSGKLYYTRAEKKWVDKNSATRFFSPKDAENITKALKLIGYDCRVEEEIQNIPINRK